MFRVEILCGPNERSPAAAFDTDLLVVGCGIAGAASALQAARLGMRVTMLSSAPNVDDCNSFWAQGGIIYKAEVSIYVCTSVSTASFRPRWAG